MDKFVETRLVLTPELLKRARENHAKWWKIHEYPYIKIPKDETVDRHWNDLVYNNYDFIVYMLTYYSPQNAHTDEVSTLHSTLA